MKNYNNLIDLFNKNYIIFLVILVIIILFFLFNYNMTSKSNKVVVFDLDETLGQFSQLGIIVDAIEKVIKKKLNQNEFNYLLDVFPLYLRPDIFKTLNYLKNNKEKNQLDKVIIFTNNQGPKDWANKIKNYFNYKLKFILFDQVIGAYRINGKQVERLRTSHNKRHSDLIKIARLSNNTKICFIDDLHHEEMQNDNLFYINIYPYEYEYTLNSILQILEKNIISDKYALNMIYRDISRYKIEKNKIINQKEISKELYENIKLFFSN